MRIERDAVRASWPLLLIEGVLGVTVGILVLAFPAFTILALSLMLGFTLLVQGVIQVALGVRGGGPGRWWAIAFGVLSLVAGILVLFHPGAGVVALAIGLLLWFVVIGINDLFRAATTSDHRGWNAAMGVLALLAAIVLIFSPGAALGTIAFLAGLGFLLRGGSEIGLALSVRRSA